jgi:hypothetical protein
MPSKHRKKKYNIRDGWSPAQAPQNMTKACWMVTSPDLWETLSRDTDSRTKRWPKQRNRRLQKNTRGSSEFWCRKTCGPRLAASQLGYFACVMCSLSTYQSTLHKHWRCISALSTLHKQWRCICALSTAILEHVSTVRSYKLQICQQLLQLPNKNLQFWMGRTWTSVQISRRICTLEANIQKNERRLGNYIKWKMPIAWSTSTEQSSFKI